MSYLTLPRRGSPEVDPYGVLAVKRKNLQRENMKRRR
jgi:hypothetical protein